MDKREARFIAQDSKSTYIALFLAATYCIFDTIIELVTSDKILYLNLANINLPISAMDVRKVQTVVKEIYSGGTNYSIAIACRLLTD